jgi:hypothetical protein
MMFVQTIHFGGQYPITKMNDEVIIATRMDEQRDKPAETIAIDRVDASPP